jgi:dipeptidyl aminopeptidase/acylaminoacyl peptidase
MTDVTDRRGQAEPATVVPLIPREALFGNPQLLCPAISPNSRQLAWIAPDDGVLNVWVSSIDGEPGSKRVVTADRDRGIRLSCWSPDGASILYLQDTDGDEKWRLYIVAVDTGQIRCLTPLGVQARVMAIDKRHPHHILVGLNLNQPLHDVYRLNLNSGELVKVCHNPGFMTLLADTDLRVRAALAPLPDGGGAILVRDDDAGQWRPLLHFEQQDTMCTRLLAFSADGARLLCITSVGANAAQLVWLDVTTGAQQVVAGDPIYDVEDVRWHIDTNEPRLVSFHRDRLDLVVLDATITDDITTLTALGGDLTVLGSDHADTIWLAATVHDDGPTRFYLYDRATRQARPLFTHRPDLPQPVLARMEPFSIHARDGLQLHGFVTFPPGAPRRDLPAVLLVHGGPWHRDRWGFNPEVQLLANRGYVVVQVNFRGSTGYGKQHANAGDREWGAKMHTDLLDALAWTIEQGWVDPARVGIYGMSYGGYASLVGAAFSPQVFACAVSVAGPVNLATMIEAMPAYVAPLKAQALTRIGDPATEPNFLWDRSPLSRVDDIRCPLLIVQGGNDPRVTPAETDQMVAALATKDIPYRCLVFPDEGHGLAKPQNRLRFYRELEQFLAQHLGGRAADTGEVALPTGVLAAATPDGRYGTRQ